MSNLEGRVKPFLGPMLVAAKQTPLDFGRQKILATWAVKTAFMFQYLHKDEHVIPGTAYRELYSLQQPSNRYIVLIAHRTTYHDSAGRELIVGSREEVVRQAYPDSDFAAKKMKADVLKGCSAFRVTFTIGAAAFQVFGHNFSATAHLTMPDLDVSRVIWPIRASTSWPPLLSLESIGGFDSWHSAFNPPPNPWGGKN